jgi:ArsR family transcriptional regulator
MPLRLTQHPEMLVGWLGSLADPTRLRLLRLLERQELGVVELCQILQLPQSTVSRHLKVLMDLRWVHSRKQGTTHLYRMTLDELEPATRKLWMLAREQTEDWATIEQDLLRLARRLADREKDSRAFFAGAAAQWDKLRTELYGDRFGMQAMLSLLPSGYVVADLGCGTGQVLADLAPHVKRVIGVDNSPAMLKAARRRTAELPNVELKTGELAALPLDDASCDAALMLLVLTYTGDPQHAICEMARIIKPGGRAIIVDLLPHDRDDFRRQYEQRTLGFDPSELERMLSLAGLSPLPTRRLEPEPQARGPALFLGVARKA